MPKPLLASVPTTPPGMPTTSDTSLDAPARLAVRLLEADRLSLGRAAELAGTDVRGLLDTMGLDMLPVVVEAEVEDAVTA